MTGTTYNLSRPNGYGGAGEVLDQRRAHSLTEAMRAYRTGDTLVSRPATGAGMISPWSPVTPGELDALNTEDMPPYAVRKLSDYRRTLTPIVPWQAGDDIFSTARTVTPRPAPAPISSQSGLASIRAGKAVSTAPGHFPNCQGCSGECGI